MKRNVFNALGIVFLVLLLPLGGCSDPNELEQQDAENHAAIEPTQVAEMAVAEYGVATEAALAEMVRFQTFAREGVSVIDDPEFIGLKNYLELTADNLGLEFRDYGHVLVISLAGENHSRRPERRLGIVTHGDVVPADASKWSADPFSLDVVSEPGRLIARGTEDDKGPIATALFAMKAIADSGIRLQRSVELYVYLAEESDWGPLREFLQQHEMPELNITIDASYPVVVAEKGWSQIRLSFGATGSQAGNSDGGPTLVSLEGGVFASQIPEDARAILSNLSDDHMAALQKRAAELEAVEFTFRQMDNFWEVSTKGRAAHSSQPENGINAIAYLCESLAGVVTVSSGAGQACSFVRDNIGLEHLGEKFGDIAYAHEFMGPMTVALTVVTTADGATTLTINLRRPVGKDAAVLQRQIESHISEWAGSDSSISDLEITIGEPMLLDDAPHVKTLLSVFERYTGIENPQPVSIGGSTNAKLLPNAVSFGPSMPGAEYTGHSEHEFITREQLLLNLKMYTAMMIEAGNLD